MNCYLNCCLAETGDALLLRWGINRSGYNLSLNFVPSS